MLRRASAQLGAWNMKACPVTYERNGKWWRFVWIDRQGRRRRRGGGAVASVAEREIKRQCFELAAQLGRGAVVPGSQDCPTLKEWLGDYEAQRTDLANTTMLLHQHTGRLLTDFFDPGIKIDAITRSMAAEWYADVGKKVPTRQTQCKHARNAKVIFRLAVDQDLIPFCPFDKLTGTPPAKEVEFRQLTDAEVTQLIDNTTDSAWRRLFALCALAGLRRGEALRLTWEDIDWKGNRLTVMHEGEETTKKRKRTVLMEPQLANVLADIGEPDELVCPISDFNLNRQAEKWIELAGLTPWPEALKTLRRNRATSWRQKYPEHVVDAWLGHSLMVARKHYAAVPESAYQGVGK